MRSIEIAHYGCKELRTLPHRYDKMAVLCVDLNLTGSVRTYRLHSSRQLASLRHGKFESLTTHLGFQFVRRAIGDHTPMIDDGNLVGKLIGLLQVLRSQ